MKIFTGKYIRETLGLRSTDFDIKIENNNVILLLEVMVMVLA